MKPLKIQYELKLRGIQQADIARDLGVSSMAVSHVVNRTIVSDRIMRAVAAAIGRDHREVFPDYYLSKPKRSTSKVSNF